VGNRKARAISERERRRIWRTLDAHAEQGDFGAIRMRAIATLVIFTTLRLSEVLALRLEQLVEDVDRDDPRIVASFWLARTQAKGRPTKTKKGRGRKTKPIVQRGYTSERTVTIPRRARDALRTYLRELRRRGWGGWQGSPWITIKGRGEVQHDTVSKRAVQHAWAMWQRRSGVSEPYRFHDLRHTAITKISNATDNVFEVALIAGHNNVRTTQRYVHASPERLSAIAERAAAEL